MVTYIIVNTLNRKYKAHPVANEHADNMRPLSNLFIMVFSLLLSATSFQPPSKGAWALQL
jgi:hypothetical protein